MAAGHVGLHVTKEWAAMTSGPSVTPATLGQLLLRCRLGRCMGCLGCLGRCEDLGQCEDAQDGQPSEGNPPQRIHRSNACGSGQRRDLTTPDPATLWLKCCRSSSRPPIDEVSPRCFVHPCAARNSNASEGIGWWLATSSQTFPWLPLTSWWQLPTPRGCHDKAGGLLARCNSWDSGPIDSGGSSSLRHRCLCHDGLPQSIPRPRQNPPHLQDWPCRAFEGHSGASLDWSCFSSDASGPSPTSRAVLHCKRLSPLAHETGCPACVKGAARSVPAVGQ